MKITLDENGERIPDAKVEEWVDAMLEYKHPNVHVANMIVIDCFRSRLIQMPEWDRPKITWIFYGREVHFDKDLRSHDAWSNPLTDLSAKFLSVLIGGKA